MRQLAAACGVVSLLSVQLSAQDRSAPLKEVSVGFQPPASDLPIAARAESVPSPTLQMLGLTVVEPLPAPVEVGPFTLETPRLRGEIIRLSLPVGEYVTRGVRSLAAANRRRQETAARRKVEAELKALAKR